MPNCEAKKCKQPATDHWLAEGEYGFLCSACKHDYQTSGEFAGWDRKKQVAVTPEEVSDSGGVEAAGDSGADTAGSDSDDGCTDTLPEVR